MRRFLHLQLILRLGHHYRQRKILCRRANIDITIRRMGNLRRSTNLRTITRNVRTLPRIESLAHHLNPPILPRLKAPSIHIRRLSTKAPAMLLSLRILLITLSQDTLKLLIALLILCILTLPRNLTRPPTTRLQATNRLRTMDTAIPRRTSPPQVHCNLLKNILQVQ